MSAMTELSQSGSTEEIAPESMTGLLEEVLREFAEPAPDADPLHVELLTSEILGEWWDAGDDLADELVAYATAAPEPDLLAAPLAALRALATTTEQREAAGLALEKLGLTEPAWAAGLGQVTVGECWQTADVYGDESSVLCVFGTGESEHGLLVSISYARFGGWADEAAIISSPAEVVSELRTQAADSEDLVTFERITPARAHRLLEDAFAGTERQDEPEITDDYVRFRALALARTRALPEPEPAEAPSGLSPEAGAAVIDEFFRDTDAEDTEAARACVLRLIEFGVAHDPRRPLRVGPAKLVSFVDAVDDGEIELTDEQDEAIADVLPAWARWGASRDGLPEQAVELLLEAVDERLYERTLDGESSVYLADVEDLDEANLPDLLARRQFAVPSVYTEIGDEEVELDPSDPVQRRLLVIGEYPEFQDSLAEDGSDDDAFRVITAYATVVDQLWDNEPPEVWQAAQRLADQGLERHEVLDTLAGVLEELLEPSEGEDEDLEFDVDEYLNAVDDLGQNA